MANSAIVQLSQDMKLAQIEEENEWGYKLEEEHKLSIHAAESELEKIQNVHERIFDQSEMYSKLWKNIKSVILSCVISFSATLYVCLGILNLISDGQGG